MEKEFTKQQMENATQMQELRSDLKYIRDKVDKIEQRLDKDYVTIDQFNPVKNIVYGLVGIILTSVVVALLALVIIKV